VFDAYIFVFCCDRLAALRENMYTNWAVKCSVTAAGVATSVLQATQYFSGDQIEKKKHKHVLSTIVQMLDVITSFNFNCYSPMMD
jgi:hypothetical protein